MIRGTLIPRSNLAGFGAWTAFMIKSLHKDQNFLAEVIAMRLHLFFKVNPLILVLDEILHGVGGRGS
jgi:hypothetical protein